MGAGPGRKDIPGGLRARVEALRCLGISEETTYLPPLRYRLGLAPRWRLRGKSQQNDPTFVEQQAHYRTRGLVLTSNFCLPHSNLVRLELFAPFNMTPRGLVTRLRSPREKVAELASELAALGSCLALPQTDPQRPDQACLTNRQGLVLSACL